MKAASCCQPRQPLPRLLMFSKTRQQAPNAAGCSATRAVQPRLSRLLLPNHARRAPARGVKRCFASQRIRCAASARHVTPRLSAAAPVNAMVVARASAVSGQPRHGCSPCCAQNHAAPRHVHVQLSACVRRNASCHRFTHRK